MTYRERRILFYGVMTGLALFACVGAKIQYKYYGLDVPAPCYTQGALLGPKPKDDLPLTVCQPDATNKFKCTHLLTPEFERLMIDLNKCQTQLAACQHECGS